MKKFITIILGTILLFSVAFIIIFLNIDSYKINKISSHSEFDEYSNDLLIRLDDTDADTMLEIKEKYFEQLTSTIAEVSVFEVEAQSTYVQKGNTYIQDAIVKKIIQGDETILGKKIHLTKTGGIIVKQNSKSKVYIDTLTCVNIMKPNDRYLVFCEKSELSDMLNQDIPQYRFVTAKFALLNIDKDDTKAISNYIIEGEDSFITYNQYKNQEFFVTSDETLSAFLKIKHEIFEKYGVE